MKQKLTSAIAPFVEMVNDNKAEDVGLAIFEFIFSVMTKLHDLGIPEQRAADIVGEACAETFGSLGAFMCIIFRQIAGSQIESASTDRNS